MITKVRASQSEWIEYNHWTKTDRNKSNTTCRHRRPKLYNNYIYGNEIIENLEFVFSELVVGCGEQDINQK